MKTRVNKETSAFLSLVRAGLWERNVELREYVSIDYAEIMRIAEEQTVVGLITAGLEHVVDVKIPQEWALQFIGSTLQIEQRNNAMNAFVAKLIALLRQHDIYVLLVKGQGVAQCYDRPLWRSAGDIDFYLSADNYEKAKLFLIPMSQNIEPEDKIRQHIGMNINDWLVELHGTMYTSLSKSMNRVSDDVHNDIFYNGNVRSWDNGGVQVFLPSPDNDVVIVFNHIIDHFYGEGIGLRQVCDWCRLLWTYRDQIDLRKLESRISKSGLMMEWKAFGAFAVEYLGMPCEAMPFYTNTFSYSFKAEKIGKLIFETGSFGVNKDDGYRIIISKFKSNLITFWVRLKEFARLSTIFPVNAPSFFVTYVFGRAKAVMKNGNTIDKR